MLTGFQYIWRHINGNSLGMLDSIKWARAVSHSCCFPDSPVRTWQSCPGIWALGEGLGIKDHLRLTRCSCPWELLRGWMSTCSCPSWMRPTCPEREKQTSVILTRTCPGPAAEAGEATPPRPGPALGLQLCRVREFMEPMNELVCDPAVSCWGSGDGRQRLRHNSTHSLCSLSKIYYSVCFFKKKLIKLFLSHPPKVSLRRYLQKCWE